jgi:hypothetical protein
MKSYRLQIKIIGLALVLVWISTGTFAQFTKAGGGVIFKNPVSYESESGGFIGAHLSGIYELNLPFHLSPGFTFVLPSGFKEKSPGYLNKITNSLYMFDINAHYVFNSLDRAELYGLGGVNLSIFRYRWKLEIDPDFSESGGHTNFYPGLNLGGGAYLRLNDQFDFFAEGKIILSKNIQVIASAGILVNLQWLAQNDEE